MKSPIAIKQQGVSLIELLLVMFLVGLMVTWGRQGWYRHQQREQLVTNAQQLLAFLTRIKADADWHNHTILLWVQHSGRGCLGRFVMAHNSHCVRPFVPEDTGFCV